MVAGTCPRKGAYEHRTARLADAEQGLNVMHSLKRAGLGTALAGFVMLGHAAPISAQEMSEKSVQTLMEYAWALVPDRFTKHDGVTIEVDRNKRAAIEVPMDTAREVIRVGRLSAHAQMCKLKEESTANYRSLMFREDLKKKWTEQQMLYMNQLHLVTVMLLTGKLQLIEREDGKEGKEPKVIEDNVGKQVKSCTDEQAAKIKEAILKYVLAGPHVKSADGPPAPSGPAATPASAAAPAAAKK